MPRVYRRALVIAAAVIAGLALIWEGRIRPIAREIAARQAEITAQQAMNQGVSAILDGLTGYEMVEISRDGDGNIVSASGNMAAVNRFRLGTLSGSTLLSGRGPALSCRFLPAGSYALRLESSFSEAGINQTRWQLALLLETRIDAFLAGERVSVTVPAEYLIADTILVGQTPENYTRVLTDGEGLVGDLNDYGTQD